MTQVNNSSSTYFCSIFSRKAYSCLLVVTSCFADNVAQFDSMQAYDVADMFKQYLRELPECLVTNKLSDTFLSIYQHVPQELRLEALQSCVLLLPGESDIEFNTAAKCLSSFCRYYASYEFLVIFHTIAITGLINCLGVCSSFFMLCAQLHIYVAIHCIANFVLQMRIEKYWRVCSTSCLTWLPTKKKIR